jgi:hypothetical protein
VKTSHTALIAGLSVAVAILAIGCGGKSNTTVAEFVNKGYELDVQHEKTAAPLRDQLDAATSSLAPTDKLPAGVADTFAKLFDEEDRFAAAIGGIRAPREATAIQTEAVAALKADVAYGRKVIGALGAGATAGDLNTGFESDEGVAVQTRREHACKAMQKLADDNGIKVDMTC